MRKAADPACLQEKTLDDAAWSGAGSALLQRYGVQMAKLIEETFDRAAYQPALTQRGGAVPSTEIEAARA